MNASRRGFIRSLAAASAFAIGGCKCPFGSQKVKLAVAGVMGKGFSDWFPMVRCGLAELVAVCDVDRGQLAKAEDELRKKGFDLDLSRVPFFTDYRRMLEQAPLLGIEALTVSTTDHMHAPIAISAMKLGIHVYVQKPLVRTLWELDYFQKTARANRVVTQMGNQGSATEEIRRAAELLRAGVIGEVRECHLWTNRPVWPQGLLAKKASLGAADPIPAGLDWEAWIGTARMRSYKGAYPAGTPSFNPWGDKLLAPNVYHAFNWRGFVDFGQGALGDMSCHMVNLPFRGLELGKVVKAECLATEEANDVTFPMRSKVRITYAARPSAARPGVMLPPVDLYWYDGNFDGKMLPPADLMPQVVASTKSGKVPETGMLVLGSKGILFKVHEDGAKLMVAMKGEKAAKVVTEHEATRDVAQTIPRAIELNGFAQMEQEKRKDQVAVLGESDAHYVEFLNAIRGEGPVYAETKSRCYSDIEHSIPMMEGILVACCSQLTPGALTWDSAARSFDNAAANKLIRPYVRAGWEF